MLPWNPALNGGAGGWDAGSPTKVTRFVWSGWLMLLELDGLRDCGSPGSSAECIVRKYTWGLDLAGQNGQVNSLESAGAIGGLLAAYDASRNRPLWYFYDANGNVGPVLTMISVGGPNYRILPAAQYEYDPYGNRVNAPAENEYEQPLRFSTKPFDVETGMGYWGVRYYRPDVGRWANRDPIEEAGGVNLYTYVMNEPVGGVDGLGYYWQPCPHPPGLCGPVATSQATSQPAAGPPSPPVEEDECIAMCRIVKAQGATVYRACLAGRRVFPDWECGPHCARFNNAQGKTPATFACEAGCTTVRAGRPRRRIPNNPLAPVNGCTSPLGNMPAGVDFGPACNEHDRCYGTCGKSKATCDEEFYADMMHACLGYPPCAMFAELYYHFVRDLGQSYYCDAQAASGCPVQLECQ